MARPAQSLQFDDRLATVLRTRADTATAARTQYRQLIDLLGSRGARMASALADAAHARLDALGDVLPATVQSAILREPGMRVRNPALVDRLARAEPQVAAAALATAHLDESEWLPLIPRLPLIARGFLRHRRDLPMRARAMLEQLGVQDLVLPQPPANTPPAAPAADPGKPAAAPPEAHHGIADLVRRIEEFRRRRSEGHTAPRLPLPGLDDAEAAEAAFIDFATDAAGVVQWTPAPVAPLLVGLTLLAPAAPRHGTLPATAARKAVALRQVLRDVPVTLDGPAEIAGPWRLAAAPRFTAHGGFAGYDGRLRRAAEPAAPPADPEADRVRQVLHELRTPVNAIQGFAEIIQQQLFGPVPNEYRALSAAIAVDAARLLGGFEELDRLARLETRSLELAEGSCDFADILAEQVRRLAGVLRPRSAAIELAMTDALPVPLPADDAALLAWRMLAGLAGALAPGETITLDARRTGNTAVVAAELPMALDGQDDIFAGTAPAQARSVTAGMFGTGFSFRLARAEAEAIRGTLTRQDALLTLSLPLVWQDPTLAGRTDGLNGGTSAA